MSTTAEGSARAAIGPAWARNMQRFNNRVLLDLLGGPRPLRLAWVINLQKGGCFFFFGFLMWWYASTTPQATSTAAWVYLALHGSYGLVWLMKDLAFPDPNWQGRCTLPSAAVALLGLAAYWAIGWVLISGVSELNYPLPDNLWFCLCASICLLGTAIMFGADVQKHTQLKLKRGLITTGMFRYVRHPNYLGEMMIYGSFGLLAWHWLAAVVLGTYWLGMFAPNMAMKEASMSRYPEWADYKARSWWLVPGVF